MIAPQSTMTQQSSYYPVPLPNYNIFDTNFFYQNCPNGYNPVATTTYNTSQQFNSPPQFGWPMGYPICPCSSCCTVLPALTTAPSALTKPYVSHNINWHAAPSAPFVNSFIPSSTSHSLDTTIDSLPTSANYNHEQLIIKQDAGDQETSIETGHGNSADVMKPLANIAYRPRPYRCFFPGCGKTYLAENHLRAHFCKHTGERPYICTYPFTNWRSRQLLANNNAQPIGLTYCGQRFARSDQLSRHKRKHSFSRPFPCPFCKAKFIRSDHRSVHMRLHFKTLEEIEEQKRSAKRQVTPQFGSDSPLWQEAMDLLQRQSKSQSSRGRKSSSNNWTSSMSSFKLEPELDGRTGYDAHQWIEN